MPAMIYGSLFEALVNRLAHPLSTLIIHTCALLGLVLVVVDMTCTVAGVPNQAWV